MPDLQIMEPLETDSHDSDPHDPSNTPSSTSKRAGGFFARWRKNKKPVQVDVARREEDEGRRETSLLQIKQGYSEVVDTMKAVRTHLDEQAERSDKMLTLLSDLPAALRSMPEAQRDQSRALESIREHLDRQHHATDQLTAAISGLTHAAGQQRETIQTLHEGMQHESVAREEVRDSLRTLDTTLGGVRDTSEASKAALLGVAEDTKLRDEMTREMMRKSQRTSVVLTVLALSIAALAVGVAVWLAVTVTQQLPAATP